jgi:hypothetical protein
MSLRLMGDGLQHAQIHRRWLLQASPVEGEMRDSRDNATSHNVRVRVGLPDYGPLKFGQVPLQVMVPQPSLTLCRL